MCGLCRGSLAPGWYRLAPQVPLALAAALAAHARLLHSTAESWRQVDYLATLKMLLEPPTCIQAHSNEARGPPVRMPQRPWVAHKAVNLDWQLRAI